jgi:Na+-driven multidrug efflux pump
VGLISAAIGVGATALISRAVGAGRLAAARAALGQAMLLAIVGGTLAAAALALAAPVLARLQSLSGEGEADFILYLRVYCLGLPFSTMMFAANACARGAGDTVRPAMVMVVVNVVNLALVYTMAIVLELGVLGIGLGTSIAHAVGCVLALRFLLRGVSGVRLVAKRLAFQGVTMYRLMRMGLPNFAEMFGMWVANYLIILMVGVMNAAAVARDAATHAGGAASNSAGLLGSHLLAIRIEAFSFIFGFGMGIAASALTGQYLGAGSPLVARRAALMCAGIAAVAMGAVGVVLILGGSWLVHLLSGQAVHAQLTPQLLMITGFVQVPFAYAIVLRSALHGAGDVRAVMVLTWICQWGLRLPLCYLLSGVDLPLPAFLGGGYLENPSPVDWGLPGLWIGLCSEIALRSLFYTGRFLGGKWMRARV